jgi:O-antigen/teichoic acid export membrane protein
MGQLNRWLDLRTRPFLSWTRLHRVALGIVDQGFTVGGIFVANVVLARSVTKEEYGMFAVVYSVFNFLTGLHNAAILEPYSVYGPGRYRNYSAAYRWLIWRSNIWLGFALTALLLLVARLLSRAAPNLGSRSLVGLALSCAIVLTASLLRRMLYVDRKVGQAARMSFAFFLTVVSLLGFAKRAGVLDGLSVFLIFALGSIVGGLVVNQELPRKVSLERFVAAQPEHWSQHWVYARWVLATAFVFQFMTQAYYWLAAGFLSLKDVAELRALVMLAVPVDQVFTAITQLVLPVMAGYYASNRIGELLSLCKTYSLVFLAISSGFVLGIQLLGRPLMHLIYGGKFDDVSSLLGTLALLPLLMGLGNTMNATLKSVEKPNMAFYAYVTSGVATFVAGIPLMMHFGLRGAVYGMLLSASVYTATLGIGFLSQMPRLRRLQMAVCGDEAAVS